VKVGDLIKSDGHVAIIVDDAPEVLGDWENLNFVAVLLPDGTRELVCTPVEVLSESR